MKLFFACLLLIAVSAHNGCGEDPLDPSEQIFTSQGFNKNKQLATCTFSNQALCPAVLPTLTAQSERASCQQQGGEVLRCSCGSPVLCTLAFDLICIPPDADQIQNDQDCINNGGQLIPNVNDICTNACSF